MASTYLRVLFIYGWVSNAYDHVNRERQLNAYATKFPCKTQKMNKHSA